MLPPRARLPILLARPRRAPLTLQAYLHIICGTARPAPMRIRDLRAAALYRHKRPPSALSAARRFALGRYQGRQAAGLKTQRARGLLGAQSLQVFAKRLPQIVPVQRKLDSRFQEAEFAPCIVALAF